MKQTSQARHVVLYELNEVPWEIIDLYVSRHPSSNVAQLVSGGRCQTTVNEDPNHLSPWVTWPTFHKARYSDEHNSFDLGQDPSTFRGSSLWDVAEEAGLKVGLFGPLQSWPPHEFANGGFYVPDTFSRTPETYPSSLVRFQEFNLAMTHQLGFSADAPVEPRAVALAGFDIARKGLTPWSAYWIARQLLSERGDSRYKARRSVAQVLPAFDLYWKLHRRTRPELSIFFTNHVAGMLHRFWGDTFPEYSQQYDYEPDEVFGSFVTDAMAVFDHQLGRMLRFARRAPQTVIIVATSMGQAGIPHDHIAETYVLEDADRLATALGLGPVERGLAMYPRCSLEFPTTTAAELAVGALRSVTCESKPLIDKIAVEGCTISFSVRVELDGCELSRDVRYTAADDPLAEYKGSIEDIGIITSVRLGGGNTAYHTPEGPFITYGRGITPDASRERIDVLSAAPTILESLGISDGAVRLSRPLSSSAVGADDS